MLSLQKSLFKTSLSSNTSNTDCTLSHLKERFGNFEIIDSYTLYFDEHRITIDGVLFKSLDTDDYFVICFKVFDEYVRYELYDSNISLLLGTPFTGTLDDCISELEKRKNNLVVPQY